MIVELAGVSVLRSGRALLDGVDWHVDDGERWAIVGPNGSGKTTLVSVASTYVAPSRGGVSILGRRLGTVDVRELRRHIGIVSSALAARIPLELTALDVVLAGATGAIAPWWDDHDEASRVRARELLDSVGCATLADRRFELLSSGERQRVQIARALMLEPALLLLDEPAAGLDLGARETLALLLERLNGDPSLAAIALVTHHVEEIPAGTTHALVLCAGRVVAAGPIEEALTGASLSAAFDLPLAVDRHEGRYRARAIRGARRSTGDEPAAVVFDLGGVLIDWNPRHLYRKLFDGDEAAMERFLAEVCTPEWNARTDAGRSFAEGVRELALAHPEHAELIAAYRERWTEMLAGAYEETVAILRELKAAGVPVYALSNWSAETFPVARARFEFLDEVDGIVISGDVGVGKPEPAIFRHFLERHGLRPEETVFIDDSPANVTAARALGMHAIRFEDGATLRRDLVALGLPIRA